jgi:hypothetical protein
VAAFAVAAFASRIARAGTYYVSPSAGASDANAGSLAAPFATFTKAIAVAQPGDTIYARGGTYALSAQLTISKSGTAAAPLKLLAYPGETPVLDFNAQPAGKRGVQLDANYWQMKGISITRSKDNGLFISGSNNRIEQFSVYANQDSGVQLSSGNAGSPSNNLILNTDSYSNYDPANNGENADGFAAKFRGLGTGNVFRGVRAWGNSDDGFDFWGAASGVTVENSWSYKNGFNTFGDTNWQGDGNGLKLGHDSGTHVLRNVAVWGNRLNGIDINGNATQLDVAPADPIAHGVTIHNVTAYNNGAGGNGFNFNFDEIFAHVLRNNASLAGGSGNANIKSGNVQSNNTWNGIAVDANDFISLSDALATGPRNPDGSLPITGFLRLRADSNLINAGTNVGLPFVGAAPDVGAFEEGTPRPGDANLDGVVNFDDLLIVASQYNGASGRTWIHGDFNFDTVVNFSDLLILAANYNAPAGAGDWALATSIVPEPASLIVILGASTFLRRHQR